MANFDEKIRDRDDQDIVDSPLVNRRLDVPTDDVVNVTVIEKCDRN